MRFSPLLHHQRVYSTRNLPAAVQTNGKGVNGSCNWVADAWAPGGAGDDWQGQRWSPDWSRRENQTDASFSQVCLFLLFVKLKETCLKQHFSFFFFHLYTDSQTPPQLLNHTSIYVDASSVFQTVTDDPMEKWKKKRKYDTETTTLSSSATFGRVVSRYKKTISAEYKAKAFRWYART